MEGLFQKAYRGLSDYIRVNNLELAFTKDFAKLESKGDCINYLLKMAEATKLFVFSPSKTNKNLTEAMNAKTTGNKYFQQKIYNEALATYNQALRLVPTTDSDGLMAVCFANRSAALYGLQKYEACLRDIEMAIKHGYPKESFYKLLIRRAKCHQYTNVELLEEKIQIALGSLELSNLKNQAKEPWQKELACLSANRQSASIIENPALCTNNESSALSQSAIVADSNEFGRFVQAVDDIESGDTVLVEKPYCSVALSECYLTHCGHCQKRADYSSYPCRSCADVIYCGQQCEEIAWKKYHRFECDYILLIKAVDVNMGHLALRTSLQAGNEKVSGALAENYQALDDYEKIYTLQGHFLERSTKDKCWRTVAALVLANMCDINQWSKENGALEALATVILHHMDTFPCNAHEISEIIYDSQEPCKSMLVEIGAGIYQTLSMFNHSCDPSVVRTFHNGNACVMNALSPIQKTEQIYDNYGCLYATHPQANRQAKLESQYYFHCCCIACAQNWGLYDSLRYEDSPVYKCSKCFTMVLPPYGNQCDNCHQPFDHKIVDDMLSQTKAQFDTLLAELFSHGDMDTKLLTQKAKKLQDYSQLVNRLVFRPYKTLNDCQEAVKHVYSLLGNASLKS